MSSRQTPWRWSKWSGGTILKSCQKLVFFLWLLSFWWSWFYWQYLDLQCFIQHTWAKDARWSRSQTKRNSLLWSKNWSSGYLYRNLDQHWWWWPMTMIVIIVKTFWIFSLDGWWEVCFVKLPVGTSWVQSFCILHRKRLKPCKRINCWNYDLPNWKLVSRCKPGCDKQVKDFSSVGSLQGSKFAREHTWDDVWLESSFSWH